jgi:hypothetical protein
MENLPRDSRYEISNLGRVRSFCVPGKHGRARSRLPRDLVPRRTADRYEFINATVDGRRRAAFVHSMILEAFVGPRPDGHEAAHLDGNPSNNVVENLRWCTSKENNSHRAIHGTLATGSRVGTSKLNEGQVQEIRALAKTGLVDREIAFRFGVSISAIHLIRVGKTWRSLREVA